MNKTCRNCYKQNFHRVGKEWICFSCGSHSKGVLKQSTFQRAIAEFTRSELHMIDISSWPTDICKCGNICLKGCSCDKCGDFRQLALVSKRR